MTVKTIKKRLYTALGYAPEEVTEIVAPIALLADFVYLSYTIEPGYPAELFPIGLKLKRLSNDLSKMTSVDDIKEILASEETRDLLQMGIYMAEKSKPTFIIPVQHAFEKCIDNITNNSVLTSLLDKTYIPKEPTQRAIDSFYGERSWRKKILDEKENNVNTMAKL